MPYERRVDRTDPGCLMFLIDQSSSMLESVAEDNGRSKAEALSDAINSLLYELVLRCIKDPNEGPRHYYDIGVIGYGAKVQPALGGVLAGRELVSIVEVANNPLRVDERVRTVDGDDSSSERRVKFPVWFEPTGKNGTPMGGAFDRAGRILSSWVQDHRASFPPIVINMSDGEATDGNPRKWAQRLQTLSTDDGNALVFNLNVSSKGGPPLCFPGANAPMPDKYAQALFDMSSPLPPFMAQLAGNQGFSIADGSRGFVFNADIASVITFLQIGTATHQVLG